jgi:hypothetical protein
MEMTEQAQIGLTNLEHTALGGNEYAEALLAYFRQLEATINNCQEQGDGHPLVVHQ